MLKAVIDCCENIPCNPCETACARGAISVGKPITNLPCLDEDKCSGCGLCVVKCPGLAIFLIDSEYSQDQALVGFPYEYLPVPRVGDSADAVDQNGTVLGQAIIHKVSRPVKDDPTLLVFILVGKKVAKKVRSIKRKGFHAEK